MKKSILLASVIFLLSNGLTAQNSGWQWVNPLPQGNLLNAIWSVTPESAIAVGDLGSILRTSDGGTTWDVEQNAGGNNNQLFATQFVSPLIGWAVGEFGTILKTTNAGETWFTQQINTFYDLYAVEFVSPTVGWVAGSGGTIFQTIDGGNTWTPQTSSSGETFFGITFRTSSIGWIVGTNGILLETTNGGTVWNSITSGTNQTLYAIQFTSPTVGYIVGSFGAILKTINGGTSWIPLNSGTTLSLYTMQFASSQIGWALGSYGTILKTTNGGANWFSQTSPTENDIFGVSFPGPTLGYAVGDFGTILNSPDGSNWLTLSNGPQTTLYGMFFAGTNRAYAVGDIGTILETSDGGRTWNTQNSGTFQILYGAYFINTTTGWIAGDSATILKTTNGGTTWIEQNTHTDPTLYSVFFASPTNGWAVGDFGTVLATTNAGASWVAETTHVPASLLRVQFATPSVGWAVGYNGTIVKTTNGGKNWNIQTSGTLYSLNGLAVIDQNTAYIAGDNGLILSTTNGGTTWLTATTNTLSTLYGIAFYSPKLGWADADDGSIIATYDGGVTWQPQNSITSFAFFELQVVHGTTGGIIYASGEGGTIISSAISPLPIRVWTGAVDSLWFNSGNWSPSGIPEKLDSVYIPATSRNPTILSAEQQIDIGALTIANAAKLTIGSGVATITVQNSITLLGTLSVQPTARTQLYVGGSFFTLFSGVFNPGNSTIVFTGSGQMKGTYYSVLLTQTSSMQSTGNITINNNFDAFSNFYLRALDTLTLNNPDPSSFDGIGIVSSGTITRTIQPGNSSLYRFESYGTYLQFYPQGTLPASVSMTVFPGTLPPGLPDSLFARRYYSISAAGGNNYAATLSLRYDTSETNLSIDDLSLFRDSGGVISNLGSSDFLDSDIVAISLDSVKSFSQWYLGKAEYFPQPPYEFTDSLFISDHGGRLDTLVFGATPGATDSIDDAFGEAVLPGIPPAGTFDTRWVLPTNQGSLIDIRALLTPVSQQRTYALKVQPGPGGFPMTILWDSTALASGTFFMRDQATHGGQFNVNMKGQRSFSISGAGTAAIEIVHKIPVFFSFNAGWNLVALPLNPTTVPRKITTFPAAISEAFGYSSGYFVADTLRIDHGYWIKFANLQSVGFEGVPRNHDTIPVSDGWNLIGAGSSPIAKGSISSAGGTSVISNYFQYSNGYLLADSLAPSRGYWVKVSGNGSLIAITTGSAKSTGTLSASQIVREMNSLTITDRQNGKQELYFGDATSTSLRGDDFVLPPPPPGGIFDARFSSGSMLELLPANQSSHLVRVQSSYYPVTLRWHIIQHGVQGLAFADPQSGRKYYTSHDPDGSYEILNPSQSVIRIDIDYDPSIPKQYSLEQNYPNPFNPTTRILFQLPSDSRTTIRVFNILGQVVATLADHQLYQAGTHALTFNGSSLSSGVYFYQMHAQSLTGKEYTQVQKMLMIK